MEKSTSDDDSEFRKIGDKQYHHFTLAITDSCDTLLVILDGDDRFDFNLFARHKDFAFEDSADFSQLSIGADKTLIITNPDTGTLFVGVECASTVGTTERNWG